MTRRPMLSTFICLLTICGPYCLPQQQAAPDSQDTAVLPCSRIGGQIRADFNEDAKVSGGLPPYAAGPRGPFTVEGRLLTEGRIFAMSTGDNAR